MKPFIVLTIAATLVGAGAVQAQTPPAPEASPSAASPPAASPPGASLPGASPYVAPDGYRDQRALPQGDPADPAAREALLRARGEAYHRAPDSQQTEAELAATRALNAEITAQNDLAERQEAADRLAHDAALARYQIEVQQTEQQARAAAEATRAAQDQYDRDYAAWEERVAACRAGVRAACAARRP